MQLADYVNRRNAGAVQVIPNATKVNPGSEESVRFTVIEPRWDPNTGDEADPEVGIVTLAVVRQDLAKWRQIVENLEALEADLTAKIEEIKAVKWRIDKEAEGK